MKDLLQKFNYRLPAFYSSFVRVADFIRVEMLAENETDSRGSKTGQYSLSHGQNARENLRFRHRNVRLRNNPLFADPAALL